MRNNKINIAIMLILTISYTTLFAASGFDVSFTQPKSDQIRLDFDLGNYNLEQITKDGVTYSTINFENTITTNKKGFAALPFINATVKLSDTKNVTAEIIANDYIESTSCE